MKQSKLNMEKDKAKKERVGKEKRNCKAININMVRP